MKKTRYIPFILMLLSYSCDIERFPYESINDDNVLATPEGVKKATVGNYSFLKQEYFIKPNHYIPEFGSDNVALSGSTTDGLFYLYNYQRNMNNGHLSGLWGNSYKVIVSCNKLIERIKEGEGSEMDQLLGENYFLRGYLYFTLVNAFGHQYTLDEGAGLGVPIKLSSDVNDYPQRSSVAEVYKQIIVDLEKAEQLMESNKSSCYASKEVAQALLSRVYLYMGAYDMCRKYCDYVMKSQRYELLQGESYRKYSTFVPEDNKETIFAIRTITDVELPSNSAWYTVGSMYASIDGAGWGEMYASYSYLELLREHPEDYRWSFIEAQYTKTDEIKTNAIQWVESYFSEKQGHQSYRYHQASVVSETNSLFTYKETGGKTEEGEIVIDHGVKHYYILFGGERIEVLKTYMMNVRNGYPKYYVLKCSKQEGKTHNWSPIVIRLAEIYLNRAEASAQLGKLKEANDDINIIRRRANISSYPDVPKDMEQALYRVYKERRLELAYEGHRKYDVFRTKQVLDRRYPGTHTLGTKDAVRLEVAFDANETVCYIPQREIDAYPVPLIQNK
ncbi:RagB/SusD family nutrient uptake outer membrane protein [Halosquirtibacter xylanolyticus]|uniref:RagB/SusD family nutrient uptake outer membrane protein n=1 Tax=Halosquirtibacter xylanolyticus TaxID=3374599 RepID=UPI003749DE5A|nr:RagB/SusD family nutrient uptake outer membrane protein [Prolixibacteraceae bacterium]